MTNDIKDSGPAFPQSDTSRQFNGLQGMSLRQWYAGMALQGLVLNVAEHLTTTLDWDAMMRTSYEIADAMIAQGKDGK